MLKKKTIKYSNIVHFTPQFVWYDGTSDTNSWKWVCMAIAWQSNSPAKLVSCFAYLLKSLLVYQKSLLTLFNLLL